MTTKKVGDSRRAIIQSVLNLFHDCSKTLLDENHCQQWTISAKSSIICDYVIFKNLCRATFKIRDLLLPELADDIVKSINDFCSFIQKVINSMMCISNHSSCNSMLKLKKKLNKALIMFQKAIITSNHKLYIKKQCQKNELWESMIIWKTSKEKWVANKSQILLLSKLIR